jgi:hypothetical protein
MGVATLCAMLCARSAGAITVDTCLSRKLGDVGRSVALRATCEARNAAHPDVMGLKACLDKMEARFAGADAPANGQFERLEQALTCLTTGDQTSLDDAISTYVDDLDAQVGNTGTPSKCDSAKLICVGRYVAAVLACQVRAAAKTGSVDPACLSKESTRLTDGQRGCLDRAETAARACSVTSDAADLEDGADAFVAATLCALDPASCAAPTATPRSATVSPNLPTSTLAGTPTPTTTASRTATPPRTATPTPPPAPTITPSAGPTATVTPTRTATPTPSATPTRTATRTPTTTATPAPTGSPNPSDPEQICVDEINRHRASIGLGPLVRWTAAETCVDGESQHDSQTGTPHSAFGQCSEWAQNECPGWPGPAATMIPQCLQAMWNEGPGQDYATHGHYINMTNPSYTKVACGFFTTTSGAVWAAQDFQ